MLALALSLELGWPSLDKDTLLSFLLTASLADNELGYLTYELLSTLGRDLLVEQRLSVILDGQRRQDPRNLFSFPMLCS